MELFKGGADYFCKEPKEAEAVILKGTVIQGGDSSITYNSLIFETTLVCEN